MRKLAVMLVAGVLALWPGARYADAEDAEDAAGSGPTFSFGASTSYLWDFNDPDTPGANRLTYSSLEQDESFNIDLVQLGVMGSRGNASYGATIDYGDLAIAAGDDADGDIGLQTAWLSYAFTDAISATAGRFGTPIGYEVLEPWGDPNVSRSWGWQAQPINHDGVKVQGTIGAATLMGGAVNSFTVNDPAGNDINDEIGFIASAGYAASDALSLYASGIFSEEGASADDRVMLNGIVSGQVPMGDGTFGYVAEGNWRQDDLPGGGDVDLWNLTFYVKTGFGPWSFNARGDYTDDDAILFGTDTSLWSVTLTGGYALTDGVTVRLEYRHDDADEDVFNDGNNTEDTDDTLQAQVLWTPTI
jgi:hypothetical protein